MGLILTFNKEKNEWEAPAETAQVDQDIDVTDFNKGIIWRTPDGRSIRVTLGDDLEFIKTDITPP